MGIIKNTVLGIVGLAVAGGATVAAVPQLRNRALDFVASKSETYQQVVDERDAYKASSEEKDATIASIQAELEAEKTNVRTIQLRLDTANANLTQANADKANLQTQLNAANTDIATKAARITELINQNTELQTENDNLKAFKLGKYVWFDGDPIYIEILDNGTVKYFVDTENFIVCPYTQNENIITVEFTEDDQTIEMQFEITSPTSFESIGETEPMTFAYLTEELQEAIDAWQYVENQKNNIQLQLLMKNDQISALTTQVNDYQNQISELETRIAELEAQLENSGSADIVVTESLLDPQFHFSLYDENHMFDMYLSTIYSLMTYEEFENLLNARLERYEQMKAVNFTDLTTGISASAAVLAHSHSCYGPNDEALPSTQVLTFVNQNGEEISAASLSEYSRIYVRVSDFEIEYYQEEEAPDYTDNFEIAAPIKYVHFTFTVWGENVVEYDFSNARFVPVEPGHSFNGKSYLIINSFNIYDNNIDIEIGTNAGYFLGQVIDENTLLIDDVIYKRATNIGAYAGAEEFFSRSYKSLILSYNLQLNEPVEITEDTVICLANGNGTIYGANIDGAAFKVMNGATLTIYGNGSIVGGSGANCRAIEVVDGTLNIFGGTYSVGPDAEGAGNSTIYASGDNAVINIYDGYFSSDADWNGFYYVLNQNNSATNAKFNVYGGHFVNYNPATGDDALGGNYVADGYEVYEDADGYYAVAPVQGTVDPIELPSEFTCVSKQDESEYYEFNNGQFRYYHGPNGVFEIGTYTFDSENNNLTLNFTQGGISYTVGIWMLDGHIYFDLNGETFC